MTFRLVSNTDAVSQIIEKAQDIPNLLAKPSPTLSDSRETSEDGLGTLDLLISSQGSNYIPLPPPIHLIRPSTIISSPDPDCIRKSQS